PPPLPIQGSCAAVMDVAETRAVREASRDNAGRPRFGPPFRRTLALVWIDQILLASRALVVSGDRCRLQHFLKRDYLRIVARERRLQLARAPRAQLGNLSAADLLQERR